MSLVVLYVGFFKASVREVGYEHLAFRLKALRVT